MLPQLTAMEPEAFADIGAPKAALKALGLQHGDMVYMHYPFERAVQPSVKRSAFESRPYGAATLSACIVSPAHALPVLLAYDWMRGVHACIHACRAEAGERTRPELDAHAGARMTVDELVAKQTRIERCVHTCVKPFSLPTKSFACSPNASCPVGLETVFAAAQAGGASAELRSP